MTFRPAPKPQKPERGTMKCRDHMARVAALPCSVCGHWPVVVHHRIGGRYAQRKASDWETMPLCDRHHRELHAGLADFVERYGLTELDMIAKTTTEIYGADYGKNEGA